MKNILICSLIGLGLAACVTTQDDSLSQYEREHISTEKNPGLQTVPHKDLDTIPKGYTERQIRIAIGNPKARFVKNNGRTVILEYFKEEHEGLPHLINHCMILRDGYYRESMTSKFSCNRVN